MALSHSSSIATDGLVFYYDAGNTQKSWKGAPTDNRVVTIPYTSTVYTACSGPVPTQSTNAVGQPATVNRYTITSTGGTPRARIVATGLTTGVTYSYSVKIRYNGPSGTQSWYIDSSKGNPETNNNTFNSRTQTSTDIGNGWYQVVETFNFATCPTGGAWSNFGLGAPDASYLNQTFDAYDIQFEQQSFATPYVAGTRSNTQAIVDLTNNNTVTANSLTYNSNGTFSFNGSTTYISTTNTGLTHGTANFSYCCWVNFASLPGLGTIFENGFYTNGILIRFESNVIRIYAQYSTTTYTNAFSFVPTLNVWYNLVITRVGNNLLLYSNGVLLSTIAFGTNINVVPSNNLMYIGMSQHQAGQCFNGQIANVSVHNRDLSALEVQQNFNALRVRYGL